MKRLLALLMLCITLVACNDEEGSREVVQLTTPDGRSFHFMPIYEDGVTDITIQIAWPMAWALQDDRNPAVPYVAAEALLTGGTAELSQQELNETFNDANAGGWLTVDATHAIGELGFPTAASVLNRRSPFDRQRPVCHFRRRSYRRIGRPFTAARIR